jgi:hypothetical protein
MKYIISERQYIVITEQWWNDPKHPEWKQYAPTDYEKRELKKSETILNNLDPHTFLTIAQIGTAFIPFVGPFISAGIGLADAGLYYEEGQKQTAGIVAVLSLIPFSGKLVSKLGLSKWTSQNLAKLGEKIALKKPLSSVEIKVANRIANNASLVGDEVLKIGENKGIQTVSKSTTKQNLLKQGIKVLGLDELPKKFFHGTSSKINLSNLTTSSVDKSIRKGWRTGSTDVNGIYFSENLWDNISHVNQYTNPVYNVGVTSVGSESAEKYAQLAIQDGKKGYIYEITLSPDAVVIPSNSVKGVATSRISAENEKKLLSMGIDAVYTKGQELVVLNKNAIKSFDLKYVGDKYVGKKVKSGWGELIPSKGSFGFNWKPQ